MFSSPPKGGSGIAPGPGDEGAKEIFAVGEDVFDPAPLEVFVDRHEGWEPEAGGGHPLDKGMGPRRWLAAGADRRRLEAELAVVRLRRLAGEFLGQGSLEGTDAGSESSHKAFTLFS